LPDVVFSGDYSKTSFQRALNFDGSMWEFFEKYPGYLQRIQMAMVGFIGTQPQQKLFKGAKSVVGCKFSSQRFA
jgi:hypothetical protein